MPLNTFIRAHHELIIVEFAAFAKTLMPAGADMSETELRDHAEEMLTAVVHDMGTAQTAEEQSRKSKGHGSARAMEVSGGFMRITGSNTASRSDRCSRSFARCAPPSCGCTRRAEHRTSRRCVDSTRPWMKR